MGSGGDVAGARKTGQRLRFKGLPSLTCSWTKGALRQGTFSRLNICGLRGSRAPCGPSRPVTQARRDRMPLSSMGWCAGNPFRNGPFDVRQAGLPLYDDARPKFQGQETALRRAGGGDAGRLFPFTPHRVASSGLVIVLNASAGIGPWRVAGATLLMAIRASHHRLWTMRSGNSVRLLAMTDVRPKRAHRREAQGGLRNPGCPRLSGRRYRAGVL